MKHIAVILLLVCAICFANAPLVFSEEIDEVRELLANERGGDILYLSKINLGIPGGDNWIADRSNGLTYIYVFVEIEKFVETEKDNIKPPQPILAEQSKDEFAEDGEIQKEFADDSGKNSRFYLYIGIAVGIIALAAVFVVRRKKK